MHERLTPSERRTERLAFTLRRVAAELVEDCHRTRASRRERADIRPTVDGAPIGDVDGSGSVNATLSSVLNDAGAARRDLDGPARAQGRPTMNGVTMLRTTGATSKCVAPASVALDEAGARGMAYARHLDSKDRLGELVVEHVARVAAAVPAEARRVAWLHDLVERTPATLDDLRAEGLGEVEAEAVALLTRAHGESYELHVLRIAHAGGSAGRLARIVKLADLDDHLARAWADGDPPYGWARHHVRNAAARTDVSPETRETTHDTSVGADNAG